MAVAAFGERTVQYQDFGDYLYQNSPKELRQKSVRSLENRG
jgi:hypothetical protein